LTYWKIQTKTEKSCREWTKGYRSRLTLGSTIITINFVKSGWQTAF
jgi:hypothetical protein